MLYFAEHILSASYISIAFQQKSLSFSSLSLTALNRDIFLDLKISFHIPFYSFRMKISKNWDRCSSKIASGNLYNCHANVPLKSKCVLQFYISNLYDESEYVWVTCTLLMKNHDFALDNGQFVLMQSASIKS